MKECELIKRRHTFGFLAVNWQGIRSPVPGIKLIFSMESRTQDCFGLPLIHGANHGPHLRLRTQEDWRRERSSDHTCNDHVHHTCETLMDCLAESRYGRLNNFCVWSFQRLRNWPDGGTKLMRLRRKCQREMRYVSVIVQDVTARLGRTQLISP